MDRKGIIAIVSAIVVLVVWTNYYSKESARYAETRRKAAQEEAAKRAAENPAAAAATTAPAPAGPTVPGAAAPATPATAATAEAAPEKTETVTTPSVHYTFTTKGAGLASIALPQHKVAKDIPVRMNRFGTVPIGAISETSLEETKLPFQQTSPEGSLEPTFERTDARKLQIVKKFTLPQAGAQQDEYVAYLDVTYKNLGEQPVHVPGYFVYTGSAEPLHQDDLGTYTGFGWKHENDFTFKGSDGFASGGFLGMGKTDAPVFTEANPNTPWAGVSNQYYATIVTPKSGQKGNGVWAHRFPVKRELIDKPDPATKIAPPAPNTVKAGETVNAVEGAIGHPGFDVPAGQSVTHRFMLYTGPREFSRLERLGEGHQAMMDFGMFRFVSKTLLRSMNWLRSWLGTYALAIIVLTIIIRGLMWPLQNKATQSMKNIAALQPRLTELKEKYPDDPMRIQQETIKLYKQYQINPLMGCIPMLIQIPIFFGFYNMLGKAVELRNASFLWVRDLSQPDTIAYLGGFQINILPLLMAVTMFWQMKISPKSGDPIQQRVFMFMPVIFVLFCYKYASALALYWTVQNIFSIVQLYVTQNNTTPALQPVTPPSKRKKS